MSLTSDLSRSLLLPANPFCPHYFLFHSIAISNPLHNPETPMPLSPHFQKKNPPSSQRARERKEKKNPQHKRKPLQLLDIKSPYLLVSGPICLCYSDVFWTSSLPFPQDSLMAGQLGCFNLFLQYKNNA